MKNNQRFERDLFFRKKALKLILPVFGVAIFITFILDRYFNIDNYGIYTVIALCAIVTINVWAEKITKQRFKD